MDGNLVLYEIRGRAIWASGTNKKDGVKLRVTNNGNVNLLNNDGKLIWSIEASKKFSNLSK